MPREAAIVRARRQARVSKSPATQAGEFIREEMRALRRGENAVRSRRQAIAIGLSEARRAGVKLGQPGRTASPRIKRQARRDAAIGSGRYRPDPARSHAAKRAARTRRRRG